MQIKKLNCIIHRASSSLSKGGVAAGAKPSPVKSLQKRRTTDSVELGNSSAPKTTPAAAKQYIDQLPLTKNSLSLRNKNKAAQ